MLKKIKSYSFCILLFPLAVIANDTLNAIWETINAATFLKPESSVVLIKGVLRSRYKNGDYDYPAKMKMVQILSGNNILARSFTSLNGEFQFNIKLRQGEYTLRAFFDDFHCDKILEVSTKPYEDIIFICNR